MHRTKMLGLTAVVGLAALALVGCSGTSAPPPPEEPVIDLAAEEQAVRAINVKWLELAGSKDAAGIGALFVDDGWTISSDEGLNEGRPAIVEQMEEDFGENPDSIVDWGAKEVWIAKSADLAVERGWWTSDDDGEGGEDAVNGEYLTVFVKVGDEWKVLADSSVTLKATDDGDD